MNKKFLEKWKKQRAHGRNFYILKMSLMSSAGFMFAGVICNNIFRDFSFVASIKESIFMAVGGFIGGLIGFSNLWTVLEKRFEDLTKNIEK